MKNKEHTISVSLKEYVDVKIADLKEINELKVIHLRELRQADQKAIDLVDKNNMLHFEQLNENAKRTIEERTHFVSKEAFEPFRDNVEKVFNKNEGKGEGLTLGWKVLIGFLGLVVMLLSIISGLDFLIK